MKTIIAPIDFSEASSNAVSFAAEMCKRSSANLVVVNILVKGVTEEQATARLKDMVSGLKKSFGSELSCEWLVERGTFITTLKKIVQARRPDLIVMGTKGASGLKRVLIGSNTVNVIAKTKVPVFVIPDEARFENFLRKGKNRIVLATDLNELKNEDAVDILKEIALLMINPKLRVVSVRPKNTKLDFHATMERRALLSIFQPEIQSEWSTVFSSNVMRGINFYLKTHKDTGLLAMIARDSGTLIQRHYSREMASHTHFPLLVMHDAK